ncbi:MAG: tetratricopeptide repeat protein [Deltaproteobacteria bacterium]|nr:tetratricopeptide repeat protein [Deltaproteobacteria bacterium]
MSLIHEALKKVEGVRHGAGAQEDRPVSAALKGKRTDKRIVLTGALIAVLFAAGVLSYIMYRRHAPIAVRPFPAAPVQRESAQSSADEPALLNGKGVELYRAGQYQDAIREFKAAMEKYPKDAVLYNNHGLASMALGRNDEAEPSFKKALELAPAYPEALNNYGALKDLRADHGGAVKLYEKALSLRPDYMEAHLNLAIALEKLNRYGQALAHYQRYAALNQGQLPQGFEKKLRQLRSKIAAHGKGPLTTDK